MSDNGGAPYGPGRGANEPTSFGLQPPQTPQPSQTPQPQPSYVPHPDNPYARPAPAEPAPPTQAVPRQQPEPDPGAGRLVAGRYRLLSKLGHGGMGTVWRAKDETVDRDVAVKEPRLPDHLPERERSNAFERMRREARAAARLDHPAVVNVHDVAVEDGQPWIVMEFVQGRSLGEALQEGTLGVREAARIGLQVLGALEAAHAAGILHRDVKPDNVMLGRHDRVILTDFGIAQIEGETNLTDTGGFVGSPEFIAPERVLGQRPGPASDLWSLGVVLYAATEGVSPFRRSNTPATLQSVLNATPAAPASAQGPLADAINGLLQKDPAHRPNAAQVRALLERAAEPPVQPPTQVVQIGPAQGGLRLGRKALVGIGAGVVALAVAAYLVVADPFAGPLPDGWTKHSVPELNATVAAPDGYKESKPDANEPKNAHWVKYTDGSGAVWVRLSVIRKAEDSLNQIAKDGAAQAYADNKDFESTGDSDIGVSSDPAPKGAPKDTTFKGDDTAGTNTLTYQTSETAGSLKGEVRILYVKAKGDMYELMIGYPQEGDFADRGRAVADAAVANLEIENS
ncbi:serine/threonine-protein kinase [Streptomyces sp. NPDC057694]|uniref:serine/threonine-protein kinase n=1 Tax=Streptomyces sp. NPDC057694 TaxID=3346216 RepID=UPI0036922A8C